MRAQMSGEDRLDEQRALDVACLNLEPRVDDERLEQLLPKLRALVEDFRCLEPLEQLDVEPL